jgi:hypothetical protein
MRFVESFNLLAFLNSAFCLPVAFALGTSRSHIRRGNYRLSFVK